MQPKLIEFLQEILTQIRADVLFSRYLSNLPDHPLRSVSCQDVAVISIGKAAYEMFIALEEFYLHKEQSTPVLNTLLIIPKPDNANHSELLLDISMLQNVNIIFSDHPLPDEESLYAGQAIFDFIQEYKDKFLVFLISGGGSSLAEVLNNISLKDYNDLMRNLMNNGININELNIIRKHLSKLKGGHLLSYIRKVRLKSLRKRVLALNTSCQIKRTKKSVSLSKCHTFILSDIFTKEYHNVSSGITFKDTITRMDAKRILSKYQINDYYFRFLKETPTLFNSIPFNVIADNDTILNIAREILQKRGYNSIIYDYKLNENASICGLNIGCQIYRHRKSYQSPCAVIYGGEATVEVRGNGIGGRILETALAISIEIQEMSDVKVLAVASDGKDGNSKAMGVIVDGQTYANIASTGITPERYLRNNDSYTALSKGALLIPAYHTGTNLNDFIIVFVE